MEAKDIVYNVLTNDFRTSLWQLNSDQYGSISHVNIHPFSSWNNKSWESEHSKFRRHFGIPNNERIIFHRDNTFFSNEHNQGLVITDEKVYFIPDNDYPDQKVYFSWVLVDTVEYDGENLSFSFTDGDLFTIPIKFFTKKSETFWTPAINEIGTNLASLFSFLADELK